MYYLYKLMISDLQSPYTACNLCPRNCGVDRIGGAAGFCGESGSIRIACATLHKGEEPPLVTGKGSGAVFFTGCTLSCRDCQNCQLSRDGMGGEVSVELFVDIMLRLQAEGAANINLVTGTQFVPSIIGSLEMARRKGLTLPVVWNTSGFESLETLTMLRDYIDIYLTDIKTYSPGLSSDLFGRRDYPDIIKDGLQLMLQERPLIYEGDAIVRGVVVRHLVVPGYLEESIDLIRWYGRAVGEKALFSLMTQFIDPAADASGGRSITQWEYDLLQDALAEADISLGFLQEMEDESSWLPDFSRDNPFPEAFSRVVWHFRRGFADLN